MEKPRLKDPRWEGLEEDLAQLSGGETTDWYGPSVVGEGMVSIEAAASKEFKLKEELDNQVDAENLFNQGEVKNGLPPCKRVKRSF